MSRKKSSRALSPAREYTVEILGRRYPVLNMVHASNFILNNFSGRYGASEIGSEFRVRDGGKVIGYVSYNGRVWAGVPEDWNTPRVHLVYDPYNEAHVAAYAKAALQQKSSG